MTKILDAIAACESMLRDLKAEHLEELMEEPELATAIESAYRQIHTGRIKYEQRLNASPADLTQQEISRISLTNKDKWIMQSMSTRSFGLSVHMLGTSYDNLKKHQLIIVQDNFCYLSPRGQQMVESFKKLKSQSTPLSVGL